MRLIAYTSVIFWLSVSSLQAEVSVKVGYLRQMLDRPPVLSNLDPVPDDLGLAGAQVGLADNQTTGGFLGHEYTLSHTDVPVGGDVLAAARDMLAVSSLLIVDAPAAALLRIADMPEAQGAILLNVAAADVALRNADCRANVFHTLPSDAMRADALMQFLVKKKWVRLAMISGAHDKDAALADVFRASAEKYGLSIAAEKAWNFDTDMRRNAAQEVPVFTQDLGDHDVLLVADTRDDYGRYIPYNTWLARPVVGTEGVVPAAWSPVVEQWGAAQLQSRFTDGAGRTMRPQDYAAWAAIRTIGEAVTRTGSAAPDVLRAYILSDEFELAGFKGRSMSFRKWNGQLRQPIPLSTSRALVAQAPLEGFLHQRNELDSLGLDQPESQCTAYED
ncbi:ABC transporter substrate-binding protein [Aliiroseovarius sp. Z3]|uniref:ABC transporter substrate-binding protein n=1 Tax=Aliiroseovarius sp. Z3 TaxID=2811402 RepID=UPI0023B32640|nr:ABC transporter substrate-binding protein [Aliiroseovarius sp. Z3]MDE9450050.1 ABC transporter substrate-binding protein [Aliiroseovarius sp. Z3]